MLKNKRILITGGAGSIGSELVRQLSPQNKIFILDINETAAFELSQELQYDGFWVQARIGDIRDKATAEDLFADFKPQIIFHAAALKHVSPNETYPLEAIQTNVLGTYNIIHEARKYECLEKFIYISTDKVVNANSIMGATKKLGEIIVKNSGGIVVRFGNVMGSRGSLIPIWQNQSDKGKPLTVTHKDMTRYMMTIKEACELVIKATEEGRGGEIYIMDMGKKYNILDLAEAIIGKTGGKIDMIGIRKGETLTEELMTEEEKRVAIKKNKFWIINGTNSL